MRGECGSHGATWQCKGQSGGVWFGGKLEHLIC